MIWNQIFVNIRIDISWNQNDIKWYLCLNLFGSNFAYKDCILSCYLLSIVYNYYTKDLNRLMHDYYDMYECVWCEWKNVIWSFISLVWNIHNLGFVDNYDDKCYFSCFIY